MGGNEISDFVKPTKKIPYDIHRRVSNTSNVNSVYSMACRKSLTDVCKHTLYDETSAVVIFRRRFQIPIVSHYRLPLRCCIAYRLYSFQVQVKINCKLGEIRRVKQIVRQYKQNPVLVFPTTLIVKFSLYAKRSSIIL